MCSQPPLNIFDILKVLNKLVRSNLFLFVFSCARVITPFGTSHGHFPKRKVCRRKTFFSFFYQFISSIFIFIKTPMINFIRLSNGCHTLFNNVRTKTITVLITQFKNTDIKTSKQNINMLAQIFRFLFSYRLARAIFRYCV